MNYSLITTNLLQDLTKALQQFDTISRNIEVEEDEKLTQISITLKFTSVIDSNYKDSLCEYIKIFSNEKDYKLRQLLINKRRAKLVIEICEE